MAKQPGLLVWILATFASVTLNLVAFSLIPPLYKPPSPPLPIHHSKQPSCLADYEMPPAAPAAAAALSADSIINLDHGDPTMFESFWKGVGTRADVLIPGSSTMSYFSAGAQICWFLEPEFKKQIARLHRLVGNAVADDKHIVVGTGSTQLFQSVLYALSPADAPEPMSVVSAVPYYSTYPTVTDFLKSGLYRWAGDAQKFKGDKYIELICSPNNPDGLTKEAVLNSKSGKRVYDYAYYWPQYTPITTAADDDIMLFTVSKATGHAGTRLGWALVKDIDVAKKMVKFMELNTIGVSKDSQLRAATILKVVSDGYELPEFGDKDKLFTYGRRLMARRWEILSEVVKRNGLFKLSDLPSGVCKFTGEKTGTYPAFAWVKCEKKGVEDCSAFFKSHRILTRNGNHFGVDGSYVRISMLDREETFNLFIERLASIR